MTGVIQPSGDVLIRAGLREDMVTKVVPPPDGSPSPEAHQPTTTDAVPEPDDSWWRPRLLGEPEAAAARSNMATPLLAGFSITFLGVVAQANDEFRWPGVCILLLALAAVCFITSVQCGFWARQYLVTPGEIAAWYPGKDLTDPALQSIRRQQPRWGLAYRIWEGRAKWAYGIGIMVLMLGVAVALVPESTGSVPESTGPDRTGWLHSEIWRWAAASVCFGMVVLEALWTGVGYWKSWRQRTGRRSTFLDWWFSPVTWREERARPRGGAGSGGQRRSSRQSGQEVVDADKR